MANDDEYAQHGADGISSPFTIKSWSLPYACNRMFCEMMRCSCKLQPMQLFTNQDYLMSSRYTCRVGPYQTLP